MACAGATLSNPRMLPYVPRLTRPARKLRCEMSDAERMLWQRLRRKQLHGIQAYHQKPLGRWVVDFYLPAARLVVEVDGGQHFTEEGMVKDAVRTRALNRMGLRVLRFDNLQVLKETDAVVEAIWVAIGEALGK
jgi:very-short-patch-repair endonuclease